MSSSRLKELERILLLEYTKPVSQQIPNYRELQEEYNQLRAPRNTHIYIKRENAEAERIEKEREDENYKPFAHRQRSLDENYEYVLQNREKMMYKIAKEAEQAALDQVNLDNLKQEVDPAIYNNPAYNFYNHRYDESLPIFTKRNEVFSNYKCLDSK
jgi:hypothetical protein